MKPKRTELDESATFVGIMLGSLLGAVYALLHSKRKGADRRRDLVGFGAATGEAQMQASLAEAKARAKERLESSD